MKVAAFPQFVKFRLVLCFRVIVHVEFDGFFVHALTDCWPEGAFQVLSRHVAYSTRFWRWWILCYLRGFLWFLLFGEVIAANAAETGRAMKK